MTPTESRGSDVTEQLAKLNQQSFQLFQEKLYPQALEVQQQIVALTRRYIGEGHPVGEGYPDLGVALLNRGRTYRLLERNDECEADYREALDILHCHPEGRQEQIVWLLSNLSALYKNTGRRGEEEPYARERLAIQRATLPPGDLRLAESLISLAAACLARGDTPEAVKLLREALTVRAAALGSGHPQTAEVREILTRLGAPAEVSAQSAVPDADGASFPKEQFHGCVQAFVQHDYLSASQQAMALLRDGTTMHGLLQMLLISLQRSGQLETLGLVAEQVPEITEVPWERALLELTLGQADPNAVFAAAQDDAQRGQVFYYAAARLITAGRSDTVGDLLRRCLHLQPHGIERIFALEELKFLDSNERKTPPATAQSHSGKRAGLARFLRVVGSLLTPSHPPPLTADSVDTQVAALNAQAMELIHQGQLSQAVPFLQQVVDLQRQARGEDHPDYATALQELGAICLLLDDFDQAEALYRRTLAIREAALGATHPATTVARTGLANARGDNDEFVRLTRQQLADEKEAGLHCTAEWAHIALSAGRLYRAKGDEKEAEALFRDALEVSRAVLGPHEADTLIALEQLGSLLTGQRRFSEAEAYCSELAEGRRATVGEQHADFAGALEYLALSASGQGDYPRAEALWRQILGVYAQAPGQHAAPAARVLNHLGLLNRSLGRLAEAESQWLQALDLARSEGSADPELIDGTLNNLAGLLHDQGKLGESEGLFRQVLERMVAAHGTEAPQVATVQNNLACLLKSSGRFTEAEALLLQALDSNRRRGGERDPETIMCTANLGLLYYEMALYDRAEPLYRQALAVRQEILPANHPELAESLQNLGELYRCTGRLGAAEALLSQALGAWRAGVGEQHPNAATALNNLALLCMDRYDWGRAEELFRQAIACRRALLGEQHPDVATSLDTLAGLYRVTGRYAEAEPLCRQALGMRRALLGDTHPDVAWSLNNLALINAARGHFGDAFDLLSQSSAVDDRLIGQVFAVGSEAQRLVFLGHLRNRFEVFVSLVFRYLADRPEAVRQALDLVLRRKGLAAEALASQRDAVLGGRHPHLQSALEELVRLRQEIGRKTLAGPARGESPAQHSGALARWQAEREKLEERLARDLPEVGLEERVRHADATTVGRALPAGSALVEFVRLEVRDFHAVRGRGQSEWQPARYLALVLPAGEPDAVTLLDLGEAEDLDAHIADLHVALTGDPAYQRHVRVEPAYQQQHGAGVEHDVGRELRRRLFEPLLPALGARTQVLLSPDGELAGLPIEVLPLEDGSRLIDRYAFSYVSSGRDVLRFDAPPYGEAAEPVVAADPDFDLAGELEGAPLTVGRQSRDLDRGRGVARLPGTRREGEEIAGLLAVRPLLGAEVVEARFRGLRSPVLLHLATHGFFMKEQRGLRQAPGADAPPVENPMLRSGLLLAGFNTWLAAGPVPVEAEDGMLNGEDVSGLDLIDTELAVLSACETGLGEMRVGEGVFGLRRAFVLAGVQTLIMSLWKVPDQQTQELMVDFYRRVLAGQPRAEALRQAQLAIKAHHPDPVHWAAFICQGDPGPLRWQHRATLR